MKYVYSTVDPGPPKYTLEEFGRDLEKEIDKGYDPIRIGTWAWNMVITRDLEKNKGYDLWDIGVTLEAFGSTQEMYRTEEDLRYFAKCFQEGKYEGVLDTIIKHE